MKHKALAVSLVANITLAALCLWSRAAQHREYDELARSSMRADEIYIRLLEKSLAALEGAEDVATTKDVLRQTIAVGEKNIALRDQLGLR